MIPAGYLPGPAKPGVPAVPVEEWMRVEVTMLRRVVHFWNPDLRIARQRPCPFWPRNEATGVGSVWANGKQVHEFWAEEWKTPPVNCPHCLITYEEELRK